MSPLAGGAESLRIAIAYRVSRELRPGDVVNLGIGIPTLVAEFITPEHGVFLQTENGLLGVGPSPPPEEADPWLVNAGKQPVTQLPGAAFFDSATSFAMIRGGHVDVAVLGALQVDRHGRVANWLVPGQAVLGVGGAMDLLVGARRVIVAMTHTTPDGRPKLVESCTLPLTGDRPADLVVTELAVLAPQASGSEEAALRVVELAPGVSLEQLRARTQAPLVVPEVVPVGREADWVPRRAAACEPPARRGR